MTRPPLAFFIAALAGAAIAGAVFYLVFFSSRKNEDAERLRAAGRDAAEPAAVIERVYSRTCSTVQVCIGGAQ